MPKHIADSIAADLGLEALTYISKAYELLDIPGFAVVRFWLFGHECEYYLHTEPALLYQVETDKEFTTFNQLLEELTDGAIPIPAV
jgi:hypothetical protein